MPANYDTIATESSIQVLSPTLTQPIVQTTIQTKPSGVIASLALDLAWLGAMDSGLHQGNRV